MNSVFEIFAMIMALHSFRRHATLSSGSRQGMDRARSQDKSHRPKIHRKDPTR